jgi:prevent-host-death family protein
MFLYDNIAKISMNLVRMGVVMQRAPQVEPISNLQRSHLELLRKLDKGPVFLSQRGNLAAALISIADWDRMADELNRLRRMVEFDRQFAQVRAGNFVDMDNLDHELAVMNAGTPVP